MFDYPKRAAKFQQTTKLTSDKNKMQNLNLGQIGNWLMGVLEFANEWKHINMHDN